MLRLRCAGAIAHQGTKLQVSGHKASSQGTRCSGTKLSHSERVLYAPRNISGQAWEYKESVLAQGFTGEVWSYGEPAFGFPVDRIIDKAEFAATPSHQWALLHEAVSNFDIFHFQYGRSLLHPNGVSIPDLWDIPLLKALGKRVFMHFRGSDVRIPSVHMEREPESYFRYYERTVDEEAIRDRIAICERFCDGIFVSTPGLLDYVPSATWIPHIVDLRATEERWRPEPERPLVLHVPSNSAIKGSAAIDAIGSKLAAEGVVTYRRLSGIPRSELLDELRQADIVVDSIGIGDHGLLSVEAMACGAIPVAHIHERNRERNPGVPVVEATAGTLEGVVKRLAQDPAERMRLRESGRRWVQKVHSREAVGQQLARFYRQRPRRPVTGRPDWPVAVSGKRVATLEAEVMRLRRPADPLVGTLGVLSPEISRFTLGRLLKRIELLETAARPVEYSTRPAERLTARGARLAKLNPHVERLARKLYAAWQGR